MILDVLSSVKRIATFNIKKADIEQLSAEELKQYAKKAKMDGFRRGKVPKAMVEQMYGSSAFEDSLNKQINKLFTQIIIDNKLNIVGEPQFDLTNKEDKDATDFIFSATFEVIPEIKIGDLSTQEITKLECELVDEDINNTIEALRKQRATTKECNRAAQKDDLIKIDFVGSIDDELFDGGSATDYQFVLGEGRMLPDFENGILGMSVGEVKDINVPFPDTYHAENLKGKTAVFKITLKEVKESVLPELTTEFIQSLGVDSGNLDDLKKEVGNNLNIEINRRIKTNLRDLALSAINDATPIEVPYALVHDEIHHMMDNAKNNMKKQGYPEGYMKFTHEMFEADATKMVKYRLLVRQFIEDNSITVGDDETRMVVEENAEMYDDKDEYIKWYYQDKKRIEESKMIALENKVIDLIVSKVKLSTKNISYTELMQIGN